MWFQRPWPHPVKPPVGHIALKFLLTADETSQNERCATSGSKPPWGGGMFVAVTVTTVLLLVATTGCSAPATQRAKILSTSRSVK